MTCIRFWARIQFPADFAAANPTRYWMSDIVSE